MKWKKLKGWQKGGIIGGIIAIIFIIIALVSDPPNISRLSENLLVSFIIFVIPSILVGAYVGFLSSWIKKKNPRYKLIGAILGCVIIISSFFALFILQSNLDDCFKEKVLDSSIIRNRCIEQNDCDPADRSNPSCGPAIGQCTFRIALEECDKTTAGVLKRNISFLFGGEDFINKLSETGPLILFIYLLYILIWGTIGGLIGALVGFLLRNEKANLLSP